MQPRGASPDPSKNAVWCSPGDLSPVPPAGRAATRCQRYRAGGSARPAPPSALGAAAAPSRRKGAKGPAVNQYSTASFKRCCETLFCRAVSPFFIAISCSVVLVKSQSLVFVLEALDVFSLQSKLCYPKLFLSLLEY